MITYSYTRNFDESLGREGMRQAVRKSLVLCDIVIAVLLLIAWCSIGFIPLESTKLRGYFDWSPPEEVHPVDTFEVSIGIMNEDEDPILTLRLKIFWKSKGR